MLGVPSFTYVIAAARGVRFAAARTGELASSTLLSRSDSITPAAGSSLVLQVAAPKPAAVAASPASGLCGSWKGREGKGQGWGVLIPPQFVNNLKFFYNLFAICEQFDIYLYVSAVHRNNLNFF